MFCPTMLPSPASPSLLLSSLQASPGRTGRPSTEEVKTGGRFLGWTHGVSALPHPSLVRSSSSPLGHPQVGEQSHSELQQPPPGPESYAPPYRPSLEEDSASLSGESLDGHLQGECPSEYFSSSSGRGVGGRKELGGLCLEQGWEAWLDGGKGAWAYGSALRLRLGGAGRGSVDCSPLPDPCPCPQLWGHAQG